MNMVTENEDRDSRENFYKVFKLSRAELTITVIESLGSKSNDRELFYFLKIISLHFLSDDEDKDKILSPNYYIEQVVRERFEYIMKNNFSKFAAFIDNQLEKE